MSLAENLCPGKLIVEKIVEIDGWRKRELADELY